MGGHGIAEGQDGDPALDNVEADESHRAPDHTPPPDVHQITQSEQRKANRELQQAEASDGGEDGLDEDDNVVDDDILVR